MSGIGYAPRLAMAVYAVVRILDVSSANVEFFVPSALDERAAMPVLLALLPTLTDAALVSAVAGHLRRPWATPGAFGALTDAFLAWAPTNFTAGWALGDSMANAARMQELPMLLPLALDTGYGQTRQMVVYSLSRLRRSPDVLPALLKLIDDPDVSMHAMGALRRVLGPADALPHLRAVEHRHPGTAVSVAASREIRKAQKAVGKDAHY
jgi:hypothetical protein